jgi:hypothetical protein
VYAAFALLIAAFAGFSVLVLRRRPADQRSEPGLDVEQLKGFIYVGAVALLMLALTVVIVGVAMGHTGRAEAIGVLGFFGYALYLTAATVVLYVMARRSP